jgi:UDP-3-O-[3-hydroxymyristoyl] N-acetylglucosamine deacetylase
MRSAETINTSVSITGIGPHSRDLHHRGASPGARGSGVTFVRADLDGLRIPALQASTTALDHATTVGKDNVQVGTVEHLLAALMACGITDVDIDIDGPEVPIIDGSALPFMHLIDAAGVRELDAEIPVLRLREPVEVVDGDKSIRIVPAKTLVIRYKIDFDHPVIGRESFHFDFNHDNFLKKISAARTFGFMRDVESCVPPVLRAAVRSRTRSSSTIAASQQPLRQNEFVRHKILDLVGDLALVGRPIAGEITAYRGGHALHSRFRRRSSKPQRQKSPQAREVLRRPTPSSSILRVKLNWGQTHSTGFKESHPCGRASSR